MHQPATVLVAIGLLALVAGCSSSTSNHAGAPQRRHTAAHASSTTGDQSSSAPSGGSASSGSSADHDSQFCVEVRTVGKAELSLSDPAVDEDASKALATIDHLKAIAPADIKNDFDTFAAFEHAVLSPGSATPPTGDSASALEHVAQYFTTVCGLDISS